MQPSDDLTLLRTLAARLLQPQLTMGTVDRPSVQLLVRALPPDLPLALPLPPQAVVIGSAAAPRAAQPGAAPTGMGYDIVLDVPGTADDVLAFYERAMAELQWSPPPTGMSRLGGFQPVPPLPQRTYCRGPNGPWLSLSVYEQPDEPLDLRIHIDTATPGPCATPPMPLAIPMAQIPLLTAPTGVRLEGLGGGGGDRMSFSNGLAYTDRSAGDLAQHFSRQLTAAGWTQQDSGVSGALAWSRWTLPGADGGRGLLLVVEEPEPGQRWLHVRVEAGRDSDGGRWSASAGGWVGTTSYRLA